MLPSLLCSLTLLLPAAQDDAPAITEPKLTYGYLGATRPKEGLLPGDVAHISFGIKNLKADAQGKVAYSIAILIKDDAGKTLFEQRPFNSATRNLFGGDTLPAAARIEVPLDTKPGATHWEVTVEDRTTKKKTKLSGSGKILAPDFGIVQVSSFADPDNKVPVTPSGVVGSHRHLHFALANFTRGKDNQPDLEVQLRILDDKGQPTQAEPLKGRVNKDVPEDWRLIPMNFAVTLTRAGRFTVEITAKDVQANKQARMAFPIQVLTLD